MISGTSQGADAPLLGANSLSQRLALLARYTPGQLALLRLADLKQQRLLPMRVCQLALSAASFGIAAVAAAIYLKGSIDGAAFIPGIAQLPTQSSHALSVLGGVGVNCVLNAYYLYKFFITLLLEVRQPYYQLLKDVEPDLRKAKLGLSSIARVFVCLVISFGSTIPYLALSRNYNHDPLMVTIISGLTALALNWSGAQVLEYRLGVLLQSLLKLVRGRKQNVQNEASKTYNDSYYLQQEQTLRNSVLSQYEYAAEHVVVASSQDESMQGVLTAIKDLEEASIKDTALLLLTTYAHRVHADKQSKALPRVIVFAQVFSVLLSLFPASGYYIQTKNDVVTTCRLQSVKAPWQYTIGLAFFSTFLALVCQVATHVAKQCVQAFTHYPVALHGRIFPVFVFGTVLALAMSYASTGTVLALAAKNIPTFFTSLGSEVMIPFKYVQVPTLLGAMIFNAYPSMVLLSLACFALAASRFGSNPEVQLRQKAERFYTMMAHVVPFFSLLKLLSVAMPADAEVDIQELTTARTVVDNVINYGWKYRTRESTSAVTAAKQTPVAGSQV